MKKTTKALIGLVASAGLLLGGATAANAATAHPDANDDGRLVQSYSTNTVQLGIQSGCGWQDAPYHGVWAKFNGPSNRDVRITIESVEGGGKGWAEFVGQNIHFEKGAYGSTGYISDRALKNNGDPYQTRPGATLTFSQQRINEDGTGDGPKYLHTVELPKINCVSVGGAAL